MRRVVLVLVVAAAVGVSMTPLSSADELTDQRDKVNKQISQTKRDLSESTQTLSSAAVALDQAQADLDVARVELARTLAELEVAKKKDIAMAAKLKQARADLKQAKEAVAKGQKSLDAEEKMAGEMVRDQYQQQTNLLPIAILVESSSTADLQTRLQWSTTMFDTTQAQIDRLTVLQRKLNAERFRQTELEKQIGINRADAAANLKTKKTLQVQAAAQTATVTRLVDQKTAAETVAQREVQADKQRYADLNRERSSVEQRIAARIAKAKAEAARKAAAERAVRAARAARAAAEQAQQKARDEAAARASHNAAKRSDNSSSSKSSSSKATKKKATKRKSSGSSSSSSSSAQHGFSYPVAGPITSSFGMRLHPTLGYWKLHDGTDFGAGCGATIRAPYAGRVSEKYFNAAYGNRLMIDHGVVDGRYITTGYNHSLRYTVDVGDQVNKGQVIGYVGTTGYSTGCHLHLMIWRNGSVINPMTWY